MKPAHGRRVGLQAAFCLVSLPCRSEDQPAWTSRLSADPGAGAADRMADATLVVTEDADGVTLRLLGRLDAVGAGAIWRKAEAAIGHRGERPVAIDLTGVTWCDMSGAAVLVAFESAHPGPTAFH